MSDRSIAIMANVGTGTTAAGAATSFWAFVTSSGFGVIVGAIGVIVGLWLQWYYKRKEDHRRQERHEIYKRRAERVTSPSELEALGMDD